MGKLGWTTRAAHWYTPDVWDALPRGDRKLFTRAERRAMHRGLVDEGMGGIRVKSRPHGVRAVVWASLLGKLALRVRP